MKKIAFLKESLKNLKTVGTVTRSSKYLCKGAIKPIDFSKADTIIELGAGDGVITKHILKNMKPNAKLLAFEINPLFCATMNKIEDSRLHVIQDSAEYMAAYLKNIGKTQADYIVSALPFVSLPKELGQKIISEAYKHLKKGGIYTQVHYSLVTKNVYEDVFDEVDVKFVPLNVPPAFVLVCKKQ